MRRSATHASRASLRLLSAGDDKFPHRRVVIAADVAERAPHFTGRLIRGVTNGPSPAWLQQLAARLPLSQIIEAARAVMLEGAGWQEVAGPLGQVMVFALVCISLGAMLFKWSAK